MMGSALDKINPRLLLFVSFVIFIANMACVWHAHIRSLEFIQGTFLEKQDKVSQAQELANGLDGKSANSIALVERLLEAEVHLKSIANKQSMMTVAIGTAFALIAIGCGLFILGVQGGMEAELKSPQGGSVIWKSSVPGTLCFVLGAAVIVLATRDPASIEFGAFRLERTGSAPSASTSQKDNSEAQKVDYESAIFGRASQSLPTDETATKSGEKHDHVNAPISGVSGDVGVAEDAGTQ